MNGPKISGQVMGSIAGTASKAYLRALYRRFDLVLAPSTTIAGRLLDCGLEQVLVQPLGVDAADCVLVGDRLATDIAMARDAGMASALVLTGDTTRASLGTVPESDWPTYVLERINQLFAG